MFIDIFISINRVFIYVFYVTFYVYVSMGLTYVGLYMPMYTIYYDCMKLPKGYIPTCPIHMFIFKISLKQKGHYKGILCTLDRADLHIIKHIWN